MVLYMIYKDKKKHGILPIVNNMEMQVDKHIISSTGKTDLEMPEDDMKKNLKIDSEKTEEYDTKRNEQNSKPDNQEVVVSVVITTDHDDKEAHVQCNTILAVEY